MFLGLTPQAMNVPPLPASCFALRRDKSRLDSVKGGITVLRYRQPERR